MELAVNPLHINNEWIWPCPSLPHSSSAQRCGGTRRVRSSSSSCHPSLLYTTLGTIPTERSIAFFSFLLLFLPDTHGQRRTEHSPPLSFYVLLFFLLSPINLFALHWLLLLSLLRDQLPWWIINNITLQRRAQYITAPCRSSPHRSCQCLLIRVNDHFVISVNERITACLLVVQIGRAQCQLKVTRDLLLN